MSWSQHIQDVINKASKASVKFFESNIIPVRVNHLLKLTLILEYANVVWDPYQQNLIDNIEMVQCRAARWVKQDYRLY